jgi:hypothetical protein
MGWNEVLCISIISAALLLCGMGLWFTAIIPGIDRWSKRFFQWYFSVFMLCCLLGLFEIAFLYYLFLSNIYYYYLVLECAVLALPLPMLTVYLLHCCGEDTRRSRLMKAVRALCVVYYAVLVSGLFIDGYSFVTADNEYGRGPLYPLILAPLIAIMLLNLEGTIRRRKQLSRKSLFSFLIAILPITVALIVQMFMDVFPFLDICYVLSALAMYGFALSEQIDRDRRNQQEIIRQQQEIAHERASVMVLQMRPHFIYNTLMSIYSLCSQDPQKARQVTMDFTNYLRKNFNAVASDHTIPFSAELEHTRAYLAVEQAQFEDMLFVDYDTPVTHFRLPPLTLQPLVENAVKHGMDPYSGPLHVSVRTRRGESGVEIIVEDDGTGFKPDGESGSAPHAALANIRQRLEMMCGGSLTIRPRDGGGTAVTLFIPDSGGAEEV